MVFGAILIFYIPKRIYKNRMVIIVSKKICYITTVPGTLKAFVLPVAKYLQKNTDWQIYMICNESTEFAASLPQNIHYIPVSMKRGIDLSGFSSVLKMIKIFKREKFDLVQYSTPNASFYASIAAKIAGVPVRLYCQWGIVYVGFKGIKRFIFKVLEQITCRLSTCIEPDSFGNLRFSLNEKLYKKPKGFVIWNGSACGVNIDKFDSAFKTEWRSHIRKLLNIPDDAFVYGFVGRITGDKGINELLESFKNISLEYTNVHLMLVGSVEKEMTINSILYDWANSNENVHFCGHTDKVEQYLSAMDVFLLPSYREGFGSTVVEAEAMGIPVIVTDIPGPTDAIQDGVTGILVKKADVASLYNAMKELQCNKSLCISLGGSGEKFAKENFEQSEFCRYVLEDRKKLLFPNLNS